MNRLNKAKMKILAILIIGFAASSTLAEDISNEKKLAIEELLEITQALAMADQAKSQMLQVMNQGSTKRVPDEVIEIIDAELNVSLLQNDFVQIYASHFSLEEVRGLNKFYQSELGKRLLEAQPTLMRDSMLAGQKWAQLITPRLQQALKERGYGDAE